MDDRRQPAVAGVGLAEQVLPLALERHRCGRPRGSAASSISGSAGRKTGTAIISAPRCRRSSVFQWPSIGIGCVGAELARVARRLHVGELEAAALPGAGLEPVGVVGGVGGCQRRDDDGRARRRPARGGPRPRRRRSAGASGGGRRRGRRGRRAPPARRGAAARSRPAGRRGRTRRRARRRRARPPRRARAPPGTGAPVHGCHASVFHARSPARPTVPMPSPLSSANRSGRSVPSEPGDQLDHDRAGEEGRRRTGCRPGRRPRCRSRGTR